MSSLNKDRAVTNGHNSPCDGDCLPRVLVVFLHFRRGEQEYLLLYGGKCRYVQGRCLRYLYGMADAAFAHLQTSEGAPVAVVATVLAVKGSVVVYLVAGAVQYMPNAGLPALGTAVSDGIHARPCPYEAYHQHYGYAI